MAYRISQKYQEKLDNIAIKTCKEVIDWVNSHDGKMPKAAICKGRRQLKKDEMTEEEKAEINLYYRWMYNSRMQVIHEYFKMPIEEVPEKYRDIIQEIKNAISNKIMWKEIEEWLKTHNGRMPSAAIYKYKKVAKIDEMTDEERRGVNLRQRWDRSKERKIFEMYNECQEEEIPEEYRDIIKKLKLLGLGKTIYDELIEWLKTHNGRMPRTTIYKDKKIAKIDEMTDEERQEVRLRSKWSRSIESYILKKYKDQSIENVPEEYREKIAKLRELIQSSKSKDKKIKNRMRQAVGKQVEDNMITREELCTEDILLKDSHQEEENR